MIPIMISGHSRHISHSLHEVVEMSLLLLGIPILVVIHPHVVHH